MCGVFGIENNENAAVMAFAGLITLQHRGEESAGISANGDGTTYNTYRSMGLVAHLFKERILNILSRQSRYRARQVQYPSESTII
jgi:amidophosphoribosyltransferase